MFNHKLIIKIHICAFALLWIIALFPTSGLVLPSHHDPDYYPEEEVHSVNVELSERHPFSVRVPSSNMRTGDIADLSKRSGIHHQQSMDFSKSCCPVDAEIVEPIAGRNRAGALVELYQTEQVRQRFYETSCAPDVADRPCKYLDKRHRSRSLCVQQYTYSYALVRNLVSDECSGPRCHRGGWRLDYILVRSGCSCQIASDVEEVDES